MQAEPSNPAVMEQVAQRLIQERAAGRAVRAGHLQAGGHPAFLGNTISPPLLPLPDCFWQRCVARRHVLLNSVSFSLFVILTMAVISQMARPSQGNRGLSWATS